MERAYSRIGLPPGDGPITAATARPPNWVDDLIALTRPGAEIEFPSRELGGRIIPFEYDDFS